MQMDPFITALSTLPIGYSKGTANGIRYGTTLSISADARRYWLYAEALGTKAHISFNLYRLSAGSYHLKPCEMPAQTVIEFVLAYRPDALSQ